MMIALMPILFDTDITLSEERAYFLHIRLAI